MKQTFQKDSGAINNHQTRDSELKGAPGSWFLPFQTARDVEGAVPQLRVRAVTAPRCLGRDRYAASPLMGFAVAEESRCSTAAEGLLQAPAEN